MKWQRIINCAIILNDTQEEQIELTYLINNLDGPARQKNFKAKVTNIITIRSISELFKGRRILLNVFQSRIFLIRKVNIDEKKMLILTNGAIKLNDAQEEQIQLR